MHSKGCVQFLGCTSQPDRDIFLYFSTSPAKRSFPSFQVKPQEKFLRPEAPHKKIRRPIRNSLRFPNWNRRMFYRNPKFSKLFSAFFSPFIKKVDIFLIFDILHHNGKLFCGFYFFRRTQKFLISSLVDIKLYSIMFYLINPAYCLQKSADDHKNRWCPEFCETEI